MYIFVLNLLYYFIYFFINIQIYKKNNWIRESTYGLGGKDYRNGSQKKKKRI